MCDNVIYGFWVLWVWCGFGVRFGRALDTCNVVEVWIDRIT